jgi:hypothetical protein
MESSLSSSDVSRPCAAESTVPGVSRPGWYPALNSWLERHLDWIALLAVAVGFTLRLDRALHTYLNPDEALHYLLANQYSVADAYRASLTNAHPPLYFLLLYGWRFLGNSEIMLRLPSVLAGTATIWVAYRWLRAALGLVPALTGLALFAGAPILVAISAEVRAYAVLLVCAVCALYFLELAFQTARAMKLVWFGLFLYLAILSHYSALWLTLALGIYVLVRGLRTARQKPFPFLTWIGVQAGALVLYVFLYLTHISRLRGSGMEQEAAGSWLQAGYFQAGQDSVLGFTLKSSVAVLGFLFTLPHVGAILAGVFLVAVIWLVVGRSRLKSELTDLRAFALLLLLPFLLAAAAGLARLYPYTGTRHLLFLFPFAVGALAFLVGQAAGRQLTPVLLAAVVVVPLWQTRAGQIPQTMSAANQGRKLMQTAIRYLRQTISTRQPILTDYQTSVLLGYYLGRDRVTDYRQGAEAAAGGFLEYDYGGYRIISTRAWSVGAREFDSLAGQFRRHYLSGTDEPLWVVDGGWGGTVAEELARLNGDRQQDLRYFGRNLVVFRSAGASGRASSPVAERALLWLVRQVAERFSSRMPPDSRRPVKTVIWPSGVAQDSVAGLFGRLADRTERYSDIYHSVRGSRDFDDYLPALAFWVFDNAEFQSAPLSYMNDRQNCLAGDYRFTLLAADADSVAAVYAIDKLGNGRE